jgi:hypothetical protein
MSADAPHGDPAWAPERAGPSQAGHWDWLGRYEDAIERELTRYHQGQQLAKPGARNGVPVGRPYEWRGDEAGEAVIQRIGTSAGEERCGCCGRPGLASEPHLRHS